MSRRGGFRSARRNVGQNLFNPLATPGLKAWFMSTQGVTIGTGVSQWSDLSGNSNHLVQATGASQPAFLSSDSSFNGFPSISFDGTDDELISSGTWVYGNFTLYMVAKCASAGYLCTRGVLNEQLYGGALLSFQIIRSAIVSAYSSGSATWTQGGAAKTFTWSYATNNANNIVRLNGVKQTFTNTTSGNPGTGNVTANFSLGSANGSGFNTMTIVELLVYFGAGQSVSLYQQIESYLRTKYGHY